MATMKKYVKFRVGDLVYYVNWSVMDDFKSSKTWDEKFTFADFVFNVETGEVLKSRYTLAQFIEKFVENIVESA